MSVFVANMSGMPLTTVEAVALEKQYAVDKVDRESCFADVMFVFKAFVSGYLQWGVSGGFIIPGEHIVLIVPKALTVHQATEIRDEMVSNGFTTELFRRTVLYGSDNSFSWTTAGEYFELIIKS